MLVKYSFGGKNLHTSGDSEFKFTSFNMTQVLIYFQKNMIVVVSSL